MDQIDEFIDQEFSSANNVPQYKKTKISLIQEKVAKAVVTAILDDPRNDTDRPFRVLYNAIQHFKLRGYEARLFRLIEERLQSAFDGETNNHKRNSLKSAFDKLHSYAQSHFVEVWVERLGDRDAADKIASIKYWLIHVLCPIENKFERAAIIGLQDRFEAYIEIQKEKLANKELLAAAAKLKVGASADNSSDAAGEGLTNRQWIIAARFFVQHFGLLQKVRKMDFARLLAVLNNGRNVDEFRQKFEAKDLITSNTEADAQRVAQLFRECRLPKIAKEIEIAINRTNTKTL